MSKQSSLAVWLLIGLTLPDTALAGLCIHPTRCTHRETTQFQFVQLPDMYQIDSWTSLDMPIYPLRLHVSSSPPQRLIASEEVADTLPPNASHFRMVAGGDHSSRFYPSGRHTAYEVFGMHEHG